VYVAAQALGFAAHDEAELGVDLEAGEAVDDVDAGGFEFLGPVDVLLFVEAGLELHDGRDLLAETAGLKEAPHHGRVAAAAVERLLDGDDVRIGRGLLQEVEHAAEGFVRVVEHQVALADRGERVGFRLERFGKRRVEGRVLERGAVDAAEAHELAEGERHSGLEHLIGARAEMLDEEVLQTLRHAALELEAHDGAEAALLDVVAHGREQVVGLVLLDFAVGVAGDAEEALGAHAVAREELLHALHDEVLDHDDRAFARAHVKHRRLVGVFGQEEEARDVVRALHAAEADLARLVGVHAFEFDHEVDARVRDHREGMARVDGLRREDREDLAVEVAVKRAAALRRELRVAAELDVLLLEGGLEGLEPEVFGDLEHFGDLAADLGELAGGRHPVGARGLRTHAGLTLQVHHANHVELIEVVEEDCEELNALQQRDRRIGGRLEHLAVEFDPADLAVDVEGRIVNVDDLGGDGSPGFLNGLFNGLFGRLSGGASCGRAAGGLARGFGLRGLLRGSFGRGGGFGLGVLGISHVSIVLV